MFDGRDVESTAGGGGWDAGFDEFCFRLTTERWAQPVVGDEQVGLPDLALIPAGPYLAAVLAAVDRSRLNGFDLVNVLRARARLAAHVEANQAADIVEVSHAAPGDRDSDADRLGEQFEYGSDEIRAALVLTRRNAEYQLSLATDIRERLPRLWELWDRGVVDTDPSAGDRRWDRPPDSP